MNFLHNEYDYFHESWILSTIKTLPLVYCLQKNRFLFHKIFSSTQLTIHRLYLLE